jgi:hypothetical protein
MAKARTSRARKSKEEHLRIALTTKNYLIIVLGIVVIVFGYIFMAENSVDGFMPTVVAPLLLVFGYCVMIPFGILYKDKSKVEEVETKTKEKIVKTG